MRSFQQATVPPTVEKKSMRPRPILTPAFSEITFPGLNPSSSKTQKALPFFKNPKISSPISIDASPKKKCKKAVCSRKKLEALEEQFVSLVINGQRIESDSTLILQASNHLQNLNAELRETLRTQRLQRDKHCFLLEFNPKTLSPKKSAPINLPCMSSMLGKK
jgi:hypothetical protein